MDMIVAQPSSSNAGLLFQIRIIDLYWTKWTIQIIQRYKFQRRGGTPGLTNHHAGFLFLLSGASGGAQLATWLSLGHKGSREIKSSYVHWMPMLRKSGVLSSTTTWQKNAGAHNRPNCPRRQEHKILQYCLVLALPRGPLLNESGTGIFDLSDSDIMRGQVTDCWLAEACAQNLSGYGSHELEAYCRTLLGSTSHCNFTGLLGIKERGCGRVCTLGSPAIDPRSCLKQFGPLLQALW